MADAAEALALLRQAVTAVLGPRRPDPGGRAAGYGVSGAIVAVPDLQPLAADDIWRVILAGETGGHLVRREHGAAWRLLQLGDLTDAQLATFEAVGRDPLPATRLATA